MQLELRQQYDIVTAEKAEIQKMIYKLTNHWEITDTLEANITMHEADVREIQIRNHNQKNQINILKIEMQEKEKEIYTAEMKLS